ncbi:60S ribosomal protein L9, partial [Striga asiatica]
MPTRAKTLDGILPSIVQTFHSSPRWRLHCDSTKHPMWAAAPFRPQLALDATSAGATDPLPSIAAEPFHEQAIKLKVPRDKHTLNYKHLNLDFRLITDEATGEKKRKVDMWFSSRKTTAASHC